MKNTILVRLNIPIPSQPIVPVSAMIFSRWLPIKDEEAFIVKEDNTELKLWFDISSTYWASQIEEKDLPKHVNVTAHRIFADIRLTDISDDLLRFILAGNSNGGSESDIKLSSEYKQLGETVLTITFKYLNRLVSYVRNEKGQYWLEQYGLNLDVMSSINVELKAQARIEKEGTDWFRWNPPAIDCITIELQDDARYVKQDEWREIIRFVGSQARPALVRELLSNADNLAGNGHRRSAIIEAVTALEVAVSEFSKSAKFDEILEAKSAARIDTNAFASQVNHMGFSGTLRYLLPVLFREEVLPTSLLSTCYEAIAIRGNVVHEGQRDVKEGKLWTLLKAIRQTCDILKKYSN
jgi:hypothetical protein